MEKESFFFFSQTVSTNTGSFDSHNHPWIGAIDGGCEDVVLHFLVERREGECQWLASQDTGLVKG